jgi:branched-chain amino acid transport system permease protein
VAAGNVSAMFPYLLIGGLTAGSLYALIALGLVLIYKSTTIVNMALGDTLMIGGFLAFTFHVLLGFPYIPSLLLAVACGFGLGVVLERLVFRRLMQATLLSMLLATVGLSFVLKGTGRMIWGGKGDYIPFPPLIDSDPIMIGDMLISPQQFVVLGASIVIMLIFGAFFEMTRMGKWMQATADNMKAARLVGIRIERVYLYTFGVGSALACAAAVLMAPITLLFPDIGFILFFKAFAAAIFGGLTSMRGAVVGGLFVGVVETMAAGYIHTSLQDVAAFIVIMFALIFMPNGVFGLRGMRRI